MKQIYLVMSVERSICFDLARRFKKVKDFDVFSQCIVIYSCMSKLEAIQDCRKHNVKKEDTIFFVRVLNLYS